MKAIVFESPDTLAYRDVPDPTCGPDEVLMAIERAGLCGTDLHILRNEYASEFPLIAGHEFAGSVVEVGVEVSGFSIGDRVAIDPNLHCGQCHFCHRQQFMHCLHFAAIGVTRPGAFAERVAVPAIACHRLPDSLTMTEAAFVEPLACVVHGMRRIRVAPGDATLIVGAGPIGLMLTQAMRHCGAGQLVVVDVQPKRLELAKTMGATDAVVADSGRDDRLKQLSPFGYALVVDATGVPPVIEDAFRCLSPGGTFLQFGVAPKDAAIRVRPFDLFFNDWTWIGSHAFSHAFAPAIDWLASGVIDVRPLVSHELPLSEFKNGLTEFAAGRTMKVQFSPEV